MANTNGTLEFSHLSSGMPGLTQRYGDALAEAAAVCLDDCGHGSGVEMAVNGDIAGAYDLNWSPVVDEQMRMTWNDDQFATEQGAYGLAILLMSEARAFTVVERSRKGTRFDYWLGDEGDELFVRKARLEVSGIRRGLQHEINTRVRQKTSQIDSSSVQLPGIVAVVEFSIPLAWIVDR